MTEEEKKAAEAAKAEADKKAAEAAKAKTDKTEDPDETKEEEKVDAEKHKALKAETIERRKENKELKEKLARQEKAIAILQGKDKAELDPIEAAQKANDLKLRNALLKSELASLAKDAHNVGDLFALNAGAFKGVTVDLETEFVDAEELEEVLVKLRKSKAYLFQTGDAKKGQPLPKDNGQPRDGANHHAAWKQLQDSGRGAEAVEYYKKHRAEIMLQMKNGGVSL